jgi:2-methylisocitrate lyase-like PEP mutase family enzyme
VFFTVAADHGFGAATVTAELIEAALAAGALAWWLPNGS